MSCSNNKKFTKKKIIIFSLIGIAAAAITYFVFSATNSGAALALPAVLGLAACPLMCAAMGGIMWISARLGNKNKQKVNSDRVVTNQDPFCAEHSHKQNRNFDN
jgi:flagellar basal body-associated protein FliL